MGLLPRGLCRSSGEISLSGRRLDGLSGEEMRRLRGSGAAMVLQNPMSCFDPVLTMTDHFTETVAAHDPALARDRDKRLGRVRKALAEVGFPEPDAVLPLYPFQMSGGMLQRVMMALALLFDAPLLIADEATTDLDVRAQARILDLIDRIRRTHGTGVLCITHDLGVVARLADEVAVMHRGEIVEKAPVEAFFSAPGHPYARALVAAHLCLHAHDAALERARFQRMEAACVTCSTGRG
jgi:nickel transport system ATP-binding protein